MVMLWVSESLLTQMTFQTSAPPMIEPFLMVISLALEPLFLK